MDELDRDILGAIIGVRATQGQSVLILAETALIRTRIEELLGGFSDLEGHWAALAAPTLFERGRPGEDKAIALDELISLLARLRQTKAADALTDVCLIAPPGYQLLVRRRDYAPLVEQLILRDRFYIVGLNRSLLAALKIMIAA